MGTLQPIILPVTAFYVTVDFFFKKYLLQYVFITKTESGGRFWRLIVNRMLFAVFFANAVIALVVGAQGVGSVNSVGNGNMLYAMVPLPFLLFGFKWYCKRAFDDKLLYYSTVPYTDTEGDAYHAFRKDGKKSKSNQVSVRYGHPALYKKLLTPMVHAKAQHLLADLYARPDGSNTHRGIFDAPHQRDTNRGMPATPGYGDMYMTELSHEEPGKQANTTADMPRMELVAESDLDFENFKKRAEFREEFGGDGALYGRPEDLMSSRPGTPSTFQTMNTYTDMQAPPYRVRDTASPTGSRASSRTRLGEVDQGTSYAQGYHRPAPRLDDGFQEVDIAVSIPATPFDPEGEVLAATGSRQPLVKRKPIGGTDTGMYDSDRDGEEDLGYFGRGMGGRAHEDTSYDTERFRQQR
jgi:calcium permeable stress-gated cation channel